MKEEKGITWDFDGTHLIPRRIALLNFQAGFIKHDSLLTSVCVVLAESQGWSRAWHKNLDDGGNVTSTDYTFWQINDKSYPVIVGWWDEPDVWDTWLAIAKVAHNIFENRGWNAWAAASVSGTDGIIPAERPEIRTRAIEGLCNFDKTRFDLHTINHDKAR